MEMQMKHTLTGVRPDVADHSPTLVDPAANSLDGVHHVREQGSIAGFEGSNRLQVPLRDYQNMGGSGRVDVIEGEDGVGFDNKICRDFTSDNRTKEAIRHASVTASTRW